MKAIKANLTMIGSAAMLAVATLPITSLAVDSGILRSESTRQMFSQAQRAAHTNQIQSGQSFRACSKGLLGVSICESGLVTAVPTSDEPGEILVREDMGRFIGFDMKNNPRFPILSRN